MSTATEIARLQTARNTIRNKMINLGLGESTDLLDDLASEIDSIQNRGAVNATVKEGESYTVPAGYHNGSGTVTGVAGGGNYSLQAKSTTPTKSQQSVTPDNGYYGLSGVTVAAIPEAYQDVTSVTAAAGDVLANKVIVTSSGAVVAGTMANNGAINRSLNVNTTSTTIPAGYHNGNGTVSITLESKEATPTKQQQLITPSTGKVLSGVQVNPIPDEYQDVSNVTAGEYEVLEGYTIVDSEGNEIQGAVPINEPEDVTLDTSTTYINIAVGYHDGSEMVSVSFDDSYDGTQGAVAPTRQTQLIQGEDGAFLTAVQIGAIPDELQDVSDVTAEAGTVLEGYDFVISNGDLVSGTMPLIGDVTETVSTSSDTYTVPEGYHTGGGTVTVAWTDIDSSDPIIPQTSPQIIQNTDGLFFRSVYVDEIPSNYIDTSDATATAGQILEDQTAYVDGVLVTGTMPDNSFYSGTISTKQQVVQIPDGYMASGTVSIADAEQAKIISGNIKNGITILGVTGSSSVVDTSDANATAANILSTKTAYVNGSKLTGTMANNGAAGGTISTKAGTVTIPAGYTTGGSVSISSTEQAKIIAGNIKSGVSILGVSGSSSVVDTAVSTDAAAAGNILYGKNAYVNGSLLTGTMANNGNVSATIDGLTNTSVTIAAGYTSGGTVSLTNDIEQALAAI